MANLEWRKDAVQGLIERLRDLRPIRDLEPEVLDAEVSMTVSDLKSGELAAAMAADSKTGTLTEAIEEGYRPGEWDPASHDAKTSADVGGDGWYVHCPTCGHCGHYESFDAADAYARHHTDVIAATREATR
ncbi:MAG: hypothetical protein ACRDMV_20985 [Streptosporangiales bacterium]